MLVLSAGKFTMDAPFVVPAKASGATVDNADLVMLRSNSRAKLPR